MDNENYNQEPPIQRPKDQPMRFYRIAKTGTNPFRSHEKEGRQGDVERINEASVWELSRGRYIQLYPCATDWLPSRLAPSENRRQLTRCSGQLAVNFSLSL